MITIVNYGMGNFRSIENAFKYLGQSVKITSKPTGVKKAKKIILIGVGNFSEAVNNLKRKKLDSIIKKEILKGKPFLGICLGMQLLFEKSEEKPGAKGLAVFKGRCLKFKKVKVPQMGWNQVKFQKESNLFKGVKKGTFFYFMHSFYVKPLDKNIIIAKTDYGKDFCSAIGFKNIFGVQFHPEKSGKAGIQILKNFAKI